MDDSQQSSFAPSRSRSVAGDFRGGVQSAGPSNFVCPGGDGGSGGRGSTGAATSGGSGGPCGPGAVGGFGARDILGGYGRPEAYGGAGGFGCPCCHGGAGVFSTPKVAVGLGGPEAHAGAGTFVGREASVGLGGGTGSDGGSDSSGPEGRSETMAEYAAVLLRLVGTLRGVREAVEEAGPGLRDVHVACVDHSLEEAMSAFEQGEEVMTCLRTWKLLYSQEVYIRNRDRILEEYRRAVLQAKSRFRNGIPARPRKATD